MRKIKLTHKEKEIENDLLAGKYIDSDAGEFVAIAQAIKDRRKDAVLNIRVNSSDLELLKEKAHRLGVRYQTLIGELLHRAARN
jgi:predicted DNA binding CopG/RHH family protein